MLNCKSCGASNDPNSSVCAKCGAPLRKRSRKRPTEYKDIYSNTDPSKNIEVSSDSMDVFSSGEMFEKAKKDQVLDKIYKQELALGEVPHIPTETDTEPEPEPFKPTVINRETTSDIVGSQHKTYKRPKQRARGEKIPQRVIESSRPQQDSGKNSSGVKNNKNSKPAGNTPKQKQKLQQPKQAVKNEELHAQAPGKKTKPADEELVPLTPASRLPKKPAGDKIIDEDKIKPIVTEKQNAVAKDNVPKSNVGAAKESNKPAPAKKKPAVKAAERPLRKAASADSKTNAVKTGKPVPAAEKTAANPEKRKPAEKKKPVTNDVMTPDEKIKTREFPAPVPKDKKAENSVQTIEVISKPPVQPASKQHESENKEIVRSEKTDAAENIKVPAAAAAAQTGTQTNPSLPKTRTVNKKAQPKPQKKFFSDEDVKENSTFAALSYFGILFLIPFFRRKRSKLCKAHSRQGIAVFIYSLIVELVTLLMELGVRFLTVWMLGLPFVFYNILFVLILAGMAALLIIPVYTGAKAAFNGIYKTVPIVGKYVKKSKKKSGEQKVPPRKRSDAIKQNSGNK